MDEFQCPNPKLTKSPYLLIGEVVVEGCLSHVKHILTKQCYSEKSLECVIHIR